MTMDFKLSLSHLFKGLGAAWCVVTAYLTPVWVTMSFLCISGKIGMYGYSVRNGSALKVGIIYLATWLIFTLLADSLILIRGYGGSRYRKWILAFMGIAVLYFMFITGFNIMNFVSAVIV